MAEALNLQADAVGSKALVNCASQEYFGAVDREALAMPVITPVFKEIKDGKARIVSFFSKKARGAMARHIIQDRLTDPARQQRPRRRRLTGRVRATRMLRCSRQWLRR